MFHILIYIFLPLALAAAGCAIITAAVRGKRGQPMVAGLAILAVVVVFTLMSIVANSGDWVHLLWSAWFPLHGIWLGSGLLLVLVWPDDRKLGPTLPRGWNGATAFLCISLAVGLLPVLLITVFGDAHPVGRVSGSPLAALVEAARYGFDGTVPSLMEPMHADQIARGLGHPPRFVTVPMGTTYLAAAGWIVFAALALVGRAISSGSLRRILLFLLPIAAAPYALVGFKQLENDLWSNEPWLVAGYGPTLLIAALLVVVLFTTIRIDEWRTTPHPSSAAGVPPGPASDLLHG